VTDEEKAEALCAVEASDEHPDVKAELIAHIRGEYSILTLDEVLAALEPRRIRSLN
jgi:hypothetical protein